MERRAATREPISLKVEFKTVRGLVSEYTRSISKGGCSIRSKATVEPGTVFLMKLTLEGSTSKSLEIEGKVVHSTARNDGGFDVGIEYVNASSPRKVATARFLDQVFAEQLANRKHARVPVNLVAEDADESELKYLVHDLSRGGMGLKLPLGRPAPGRVKLSGRADISVWYDGDEPFVFGASVVRLDTVSQQHTIGLCFDEVGEANQRMIDALLYLHRPQAILIKFAL
jgi:c-di-GMP-binding flagellar brake protein YcgR